MRSTRLSSKQIKIKKQKLISECRAKHSGKLICDECKDEIIKDKDAIFDHKDNNPLNDDPENEQIICRRCNYMKNPPNFFKLKGDSLDSVSVRGWVRVKQKAQFAEMAVSQERKGKFYIWFYSEMMKRNRIEYEEVISSGSFIAAVSPDTIKNRYLKSLCSKVAFCEKITEPDSEGIETDYVKWRPGRREIFLKHSYNDFIKKYSK